MFDIGIGIADGRLGETESKTVLLLLLDGYMRCATLGVWEVGDRDGDESGRRRWEWLLVENAYWRGM